MNAHHTSLALLIATVLPGCSSLDIERIAAPEPGDCVPGLVVNVNTPHQVVALFEPEPGARPVRVATRELLPSMSEYYAIDYTGGLFTTRELQVELHPDSTLKRVKLASEVEAEEQLTGIAEALTGVGSAVGDLRAARAAAKAADEPKDPVVAESEELERQIRLLMLKANKEAVARGEPLPYPDL